MQQDGIELEVDCRPSDAIALGVSMQVPIFVEDHVLDEVENDIQDTDYPESF